MSTPPGGWYDAPRRRVSPRGPRCGAPGEERGEPPRPRARRRSGLPGPAVLAILLGIWGCSHPRAEEIERIIAAYDEAAVDIGWPGFDPRSVPIALTDDGHTYLVRHPAPPEEFERMRGVEGGAVTDAVLADARANTDIELAGVRTAVIPLPEEEADPVERAALAMHEAFHAWQTVHRPGWTANEVDLFTYPVRSAALLELRRREGGALRRAGSAPDSVRELCWAQEFLRLRGRRFARMDEASAAYERHSELREGLAQYVEARAAGRTEVTLPAEGFPPELVRDRAYATGQALAVLLDRLAPGWKDSLMAAPEGEASLEGLLASAIRGVRVRPCRASPDEAARTRALARSDSADLERRNARVRATFEDAAGWRIEIEADGTPLAPERFDPLNVRVLDARHVLHTRWLRVAGAEASAEFVDRTAMTRGLDGHPLFAGLDRVWVTGLGEPDVRVSGDTIRITSDGVEVTAVGASLERDGQRLRLRLAQDG